MTQCEFCGRVLIKRGVWVRPTAEVVTFVGFCPPCGEMQRRQRVRTERRVVRRKLREREIPRPDPDAVQWDVLTRGR